MKKILYATFALSLLAGCTSDFEELNRNPYGATDEDLLKLPQGGTQLVALQKLVLPQQENSYQMCFDLVATPYAGYASQPKFRDDYLTYSPRVNWYRYLYDDTYPKIYSEYFALKALAKGDNNKKYVAWGNILRAGITHWLTDTYGALPYSKMQVGVGQTPYDSQRDLYLNLCQDLQHSINILKVVDANDKEYVDYDLVYDGDMTLWVKYANSLLLRIALRMSDVEPVKAKEYAKFAIQNGVITTNAENAVLKTGDNPAFKVSALWGDSRAGADIVSYMNAFSDPRREKFFTQVATRSSSPFFGLASNNKAVAVDAANYSLPNIQGDSGIVWISASEVAFIKAEMALKGWSDVVSESAEDLYKKGVALSFEQWGVSGTDTYLENAQMRGNFSDELASGFDASFSSSITVKWDNAATQEQKLSKIITQKWIAMYPYGSQEAWAEWRRTGYPNLLPTKTNNSGGVVRDITQNNGKDTGGMRRLQYSDNEYLNNKTNVINAVNQDFDGQDTPAKDMWWVKK